MALFVIATAGVSVCAEPARAAGKQLVYTVKRGDSLSKIAYRYRTTIKAIKRANRLKGNTIFVGQRLKVPLPAKKNQRCGSTYKVKKGDSLARIAKRCGVKIQQVRRLNKLSRPVRLQVGMVLRLKDGVKIPGSVDTIKRVPTNTRPVVLPTPSLSR